MHALKPEPCFQAMQDELALYWLAGLLEGEGTFIKGPPSRPNCPILRLAMTDEDVVARGAALLGRSVTPWDRRSERPRKRVFITTIQGGAAVRLMCNLRPLMGARRQAQIDRVLASPHAARTRALIGQASCSVLGCDRRVRSRGLCLQHYRSWWKSVRHGRTPRYLAADLLPLAAEDHPLAVPTRERPEAVAWLAGLLEGEGTFANTEGYPYISATMCDEDVLGRAAAIMGVAKVLPKDVARSTEHGWSPAYHVGLTGSRAADWMQRVRPWMGHRRTAAIDRALDAYHPVRITAAPAICVVDDCENEHRSRGLCHKHYMQWDRDRKARKEPRIRPLR